MFSWLVKDALIGVDVNNEAVKDHLEMQKDFFEFRDEQLNSFTPEKYWMVFTSCWTAKEAVISYR